MICLTRRVGTYAPYLVGWFLLSGVMLFAHEGTVSTNQPVVPSARVTCWSYLRQKRCVAVWGPLLLLVGSVACGVTLYKQKNQTNFSKKAVQLILKQVDGATVERIDTAQHTLEKLHKISLHAYIEQRVSAPRSSCYRVYAALEEAASETEQKNLAARGRFCPSNQSVSVYLAQKKMLRSAVVYLYFQIDRSMAETSHTVKVYYGSQRPLQLDLQGSDYFLNALHKANHSFYTHEDMQETLFLYAKTTDQLPVYTQLNHPKRKAGDVYCCGTRETTAIPWHNS